MARISYVDGRYVHHADARVHIEDRGYQFSDGMYEYVAFYHRRLLDGDLHLARMERSLNELAIKAPMSMRALNLVIQELIAHNEREHGGLYIQVSRGVAKRDHAFPKQCKSSLVMTIGAAKFPKASEVKEGVAVITQPEQRWARRDIKSISLLANVLAKQAAAAQSAREAWLVDDDVITEGAVSNSYIVSDQGEVITHPADQNILGGITRDVLLGLAAKAGIRVCERSYSLSEAMAAREAFITSTSINVLPVVKLDGKTIGNGKVGDVTRKLQGLYDEHVFKQTGFRRDDLT
ncbi:MAG: D-amino-acid transaminase [Rickettsiales bacterium]|jgi:D-alanine transaminase|nr:D-amino-acid transaminase [Rickettsiales bacterium]